MIQKSKIFILSPLFLALFFPFVASAHLSGEAVEAGNYRVEIGSFPESPAVQELVHFSVVLEDLEGMPVDNATLWIRIAKGNSVLFSSSDLSTDDATIDFEYLFSEPGEYDLTLRFIDTKTKEEATVTKILQVEKSTEQAASEAEGKRSNFNLAVLTLILGFMAGIILARSKSGSLTDSGKKETAPQDRKSKGA